jgi:uncharacterized protein (TIGR03437 family)
VSHDQINAQVPTVAATGSVPIRVILNPGRPNELVSDMGSMTLQNYAPALFTFNGTSVAAVHNSTGTLVGTPAVVQGGQPAKPGDILQLYATGLGATQPVWQAGEMPDRTSPVTGPLTVMIGGTTLSAADVMYVGVVPGAISGLYQLNVRMPMGLTQGNVPVRLSLGGVQSAAGTTIPVTP